MFKKQPTLSNSTALKSSERRRLQNELCERFSVSPEQAKLLFSEDLKQCKGTTTAGEHFTLFTTNQGPAAFRIGKGEQGLLVPSLYTVWRSEADCSLSSLVTNDMVMEKLEGGADLMLRGVSDRSIQALPDSLSEGSLVGISTSSRHYIRALGVLTASASRIKREDKGKAVEVLHVEGDCLWGLGGKKAPEPRPAREVGADAGAPEACTSDLYGESHQGEERCDVVASTNGKSEGLDDRTEQVNLSQQDVDIILREALLYAISQLISKQPSVLPLTSSKFIDTYVLPSRWASSIDQEVTIKKSSYKNATAFIKQAKKDGLLNTKEAKGGEVSVTSINVLHPEVKAFKPYKTVGDQQRQEKRREAREEKESSKSAQRSLKIQELYKSHVSTIALCGLLGYDKDTLVAPTELREALQKYISDHDLVNPHDQAYINLDSALSEGLLKKGEQLDFIPRSQLLDRLLNGMQAWYKIIVSGAGKSEELVSKGSLQKLSVAVKKRQGKKVVTVVEGIEPFQIPHQKLAEDLQVKCASSATTNELPKSSAKKPLHEVVVQGNQTTLVQKELVEAWGVPKNWIEVSK